LSSTRMRLSSMSSTISISMEIIDHKHDCDDDLMTSCSLRPAYPRNGFRVFSLHAKGSRNNARSSDLLSGDRCDEQIRHPESCNSYFRRKSSRSQCVVHNFEFSNSLQRENGGSRNPFSTSESHRSSSTTSLSIRIPSFSDNPEVSPSLPALSRPSPLLAT
jgi:hypothetical protein